MGSEYYSPTYIKPFNRLFLSSLQVKNLSDCCIRITDGDHGSADYVDEKGVIFILSEAVKEGWIDINACRKISFEYSERLKRSSLEKNDVLVTKTGVYFGRSAVVTSEFIGANTIAHVGLLRPKKDINPYYLSTLLNSSYGYSQLRRRGIKATRPEIKLVEFQDIKIGIPSSYFQNKIENIILCSQKYLIRANSIYAKAEEKVLENLLENINTTYENFNIKSLKASFISTGRLDAEYYQKKYEYMNNHVYSYANGWGTLREICRLNDTNYTPVNNSYYQYIELSNVDNFGDIIGIQQITGEELPSRARRKVKAGDVLVSSIEGSLSSCAIVPEKLKNALCSTGFYVISSDKLNSETLLVIFKSELMQNILKQNCSGTILTAINKEDFLNIPLPIITFNIQTQIASLIKDSFECRDESERLLECAKHAVEIAIEKDEKAALMFLQKEASLCELVST